MNGDGKAFGYFALFSEIGLVLFVTTFGGLLVGHWFDQQLGTNPVLVILGFLLGILDRSGGGLAPHQPVP